MHAKFQNLDQTTEDDKRIHIESERERQRERETERERGITRKTIRERIVSL